MFLDITLTIDFNLYPKNLTLYEQYLQSDNRKYCQASSRNYQIILLSKGKIIGLIETIKNLFLNIIYNISS